MTLKLTAEHIEAYKQFKAQLIDTLYERRQDGKLGDRNLRCLYEGQAISKLTYDLIRRLPIK